MRDEVLVGLGVGVREGQERLVGAKTVPLDRALASLRQWYFRIILTNEQHETIGRRLRRAFPLDLEKSHARHDGADEVDIKDG